MEVDFNPRLLIGGEEWSFPEPKNAGSTAEASWRCPSPRLRWAEPTSLSSPHGRPFRGRSQLGCPGWSLNMHQIDHQTWSIYQGEFRAPGVLTHIHIIGPALPGGCLRDTRKFGALVRAPFQSLPKIFQTASSREPSLLYTVVSDFFPLLVLFCLLLSLSLSPFYYSLLMYFGQGLKETELKPVQPLSHSPTDFAPNGPIPVQLDWPK